MILDVVQAPDEVLADKAKLIEKIHAGTFQLIEDMKETLVAQTHPEGIGLAAPQVGRSLQLFIVKYDDESPFDVYINPVLELCKDKEVAKRVNKTKEREKL